MGAKRTRPRASSQGLLPQIPQQPTPTVAVPSGSAGDRADAPAAEYRKTTVTLGFADMEYLDALAFRIQGRHRTHINRGEIIRALVGALQESGLDLAAAPGEAAIRATVAAKLRE